MTTEFQEQVYVLLKKVPKGKVTSYKELAHALGTNAYRAVGSALRCNPDAPTTPCHRVVSSDGSIGGFKGKIRGKEIQEKIMLLKREGVIVEKNRVVDFSHKLFTFSDDA